MQFYAIAQTYDIYDTGTLWLIPEFLLAEAEDFGADISELTVNFHFAHSGRPKRTLEELFASFHAKRRSLPKVVYRRNRGQAVIDIASELIDGKELEKIKVDNPSLALFKELVTETIAAFTLLRKRLTAADNFRLDDFLAHCRWRQSQIPSTAKECAALVKRCKDVAAARDAALSPWEKLGIDWRDFHPDARTILDEPFYWQSDNDFAPHGNDTGADLLASYRNWHKRDPNGNPVEFFERLLRRWGLRAQRSRDKFGTVIDEAAVALAFAELKLRAACPADVAGLARAALKRQRQEALDALKWPHRDERLQSLDRIESKLPAGG